MSDKDSPTAEALCEAWWNENKGYRRSWKIWREYGRGFYCELIIHLPRRRYESRFSDRTAVWAFERALAYLNLAIEKGAAEL